MRTSWWSVSTTRSTYAKLRSACVLVRRGAHLVATNPDLTFPVGDGELWPGAGSLLAAVVACDRDRSGGRGEAVRSVVRGRAPARRRRPPLVVGDRLDTDIEGARRLGWDSLLVLSGVATRDEVEATGIRPTHVARDVSGLLLD